MKSFLLALIAAALMVACGSPNPGSNDTSVTGRSDASQSDTSTPVDAAVVDNDTPATEDRPIVTNDTGETENCWAQACGSQDVYSMDGSHRDGISLSCDMASQRISLSPAGLACIANGNGDTFECMLDDTDGISVRGENIRENGHCGPTSRLTYFRNGQQMTLTSGIERLVRRTTR